MNDKQLALPTIPLTKAAIAQAGWQIAHQLMLPDDANPALLFIELRALKAAVEAALAELESDAMDEMERMGRQERLKGVKLAPSGGATQWDYSRDSQWCELKLKIDRLMAARKKREAMLRNASGEMADTETGEIMTPAEVKGYTKRGIAVTFPKE